MRVEKCRVVSYSQRAACVAYTREGSKTTTGKGGIVAGGRRELCRRLWVVGRERGFLACSLDMGQEINGTSNTDANSVNQAAQRPTSTMLCGCTALSCNNIDARSYRETSSPSSTFVFLNLYSQIKRAG